MTKITKEEIKRVEDLRERFDQIVKTIGSIEVQKIALQLQKDELKVGLQNIKKEEGKVAVDLEEKYGKGTISLDTGEFSPNN